MFNHITLEKDIERLSREISEKRNLPEYKSLSEKELIKQSLQPMIKPLISDFPKAGGQQVATENSVLPAYLKELPQEIKLKVAKLVDSVFHQGLNKTIAEARLAGPFILDAFHDALTDKLYEELKKRNLI